MLNSNNELWKDIKGYEGRYQISNLGNCRSIQDNKGNYRELTRVPRIRSKTCKYLYIQFFIKDRPTQFAIHRLVAITFIDNPDNKPMVNHIDGNKLNNNACNLEWVTCSENHKHAYKTGLSNSQHKVDRLLGLKCGSTSKYHNVSWDASRSKWKATLKDNGKMLFYKRFDTENAAAHYVNTMLDTLGFMNRPRNIIT